MSNTVRGTVYDADDPLKSGRLRLLVPSVYGDAPSGWAEPIVPPAKTFKPKYGDVMWVFFENGDTNRPIYSSTAEITADMIEATMVLASRIIVGDPNGQRFELNATDVIATDPDGQIVFSLSPGADMFFQLIDTTGDVVAAINSTGDAVFNDLDLTGVLTVDSGEVVVDGDTLTDILDEFPQGLVLFGSRQPTVTGISNEFGLMECDWTSPDQAELRWKHFETHVDLEFGGVDGDLVPVVVRIRYTKDGSTPNISSTLLRSWKIQGHGNTTEDFHLFARWLPDSKTDPDDPPITFKLLVTVEPLAHTIASINGPVDLYLYDVGPVPIPNVAKINTGHDDGNDGDTGEGGAHEPQHHTTTYAAVRAGCYQGDGDLEHTGTNLNQGFYSATNGNQKSAIWFPFNAIQNDLDGATISKVELYLYSNHWYYNGGGTSVIGFHSDTGDTVPSSWDSVSGKNTDAVTPRIQFPKPGSHWVDITDNSPNDWKNGGKTGVLLGPGPTTDKTYYGTFNGPGQSNKPLLRITYTTNA